MLDNLVEAPGRETGPKRVEVLSMGGNADGARRSTLGRFVPLLVLVLALVAFFVFRLDRYLSFAMLRDHRTALMAFVARHAVVAALGFVTLYAVATAVSLPGGAVLTVAGGFLFGTVLGSIYAVIGATIGAAGLFLAARTAVGDSLRRRAGPWVRRMEQGFRDNALSYLLFLRLVPLFPFWLVNLVPALLGVSLRTFLIGTFFGIIPGGVVYASVGSGVGAVFDAGRVPDLGIVFRPEILLPLLGLAVLALVPVIYRHFRRGNGSNSGTGA